MPTIFTAAGFRFMIYVHDHAPPHIHVLGHGGAVELLIDPLALRAVRGSLSNAQVRDVMRIAMDRQDELRQAWREHHGQAG
jgi:hypothetical protein